MEAWGYFQGRRIRGAKELFVRPTVEFGEFGNELSKSSGLLRVILLSPFLFLLISDSGVEVLLSMA
jgi:hypothetical protein